MLLKQIVTYKSGKQMKDRLYDLLNGDNRLSISYRIVMLLAIILSIIPLMVMDDTANAYTIIEDCTVCIFIFDYIIRIITSDMELKKGRWSYILLKFRI